MGMFVFSLIDFTHRLIKICPVFTTPFCMCLEEILLLLIALYNLMNHYIMANMNKVFNFVCDMLFVFSQKMASVTLKILSTDGSQPMLECIAKRIDSVLYFVRLWTGVSMVLWEIKSVFIRLG